MRITLIAISMALALGQAAAADFPTRPMRLVVPFPAGSSTDVIARILAEKVGGKLGQPIIVENKRGADGALTASEIKRSTPDGYNLMLATNSAMSGVPATRTTPPYDVTTDFTPVTDVGRYNFLFYVSNDVPAKTLPELVAYVQANPAQVTYGAGNISGRLSLALVAVARKLDMIYVPYRGEPQAITDLMTGRIQALVATAGIGAPQVRDGKIRALATVLRTRSFVLPEVPTIAEAGFPEFNVEPWAGLFGPAKLPADILARLNKAYTEAMSDPVVIKRMQEVDFVLHPSTPEELAELVKRQVDFHRKIVAAAGIEMQ